MKVKKVIDQLQHYIDNYGEDVEVDFKMVAPENICDDDSMDIDINFEGEIGTSLLPEKVEIGFTYDDKKDWSHDWKSQLESEEQMKLTKKEKDFLINWLSDDLDIQIYESNFKKNLTLVKLLKSILKKIKGE